MSTRAPLENDAWLTTRVSDETCPIFEHRVSEKGAKNALQGESIDLKGHSVIILISLLASLRARF